MSTNSHIRTIIDLIMSGKQLRATELWLSLQKNTAKCSPCFYAPLDTTVRCSACLEGHLGISALKRAYPHINHEELTAAQKRLDTWIREQHQRTP